MSPDNESYNEQGCSRFRRCVNRDFSQLIKGHKFRISKDIVPLILIQTIRGHAQRGHGEFRGFSDKNVTLRDVIYCLGDNVDSKYRDPDGVAKWRQDLIYEVFDLVNDLIKGKQRKFCVNKRGNPLLGLESIASIEIKDPTAFLQGIYFAAAMDNYEWRGKVWDSYAIGMGCGESYLTSLSTLNRGGDTIEDIETTEHSKDALDSFKEKGVILDHGRIDDDKTLVYFRKKKGMGSIDDLAVIIMHLLYGIDAALGTILGDAVDTFDKYTLETVAGGYDEMLGNIVEKEGLVAMEEEEVVKAMSLIAGANYTGISHCSVRYFNEIDVQNKLTALESHLRFSEGERLIPKLYIHHPSLNVTNHKLYSQFRNRLREKYPELIEKLG
ncbi:MAG: hypothetical protein ABIB71_09760 [Candidatus Woesearchaeota archaeon]